MTAVHPRRSDTWISSERALPGFDAVTAVITDAALLAWVREIAALTRPERMIVADGSDHEWREITDRLLAAGTVTRVAGLVDSFAARSDPDDVARVEDRTFICSTTEQEAGPTNHWADPIEMKATLTGLYRGCMRGRVMYVIPFAMGALTATDPKLGVEITDSEYVLASMRIMTRIGAGPLALIEGGKPWVKALHSVGAPLAAGRADVPWPANPVKYICHFPQERSIYSFGSGYGGNALLGKKCYALRIASVMARDEGWLAEHMLILKLTSPGSVHYLAAAFPSACGKTNLAMVEPTLPGWTVQTLGDDIAWLRPGADGRLYASNPEAGFFGVAPGTGRHTNPNAMRTIDAGHSIFTNVARTDDGGVWWEGMTPDAPAHLTDWRGREWTPDGVDDRGRPLASAGHPAAHPNSRFCTPIAQCPVLAPEYDSPEGVPLSAILFGGRRQTTIPLVAQARDWAHGVFMGATLSSETTAAATGAVGVVRRDPMAMLPFLGYDAGRYFQHWLEIGAALAHPPAVFAVNWFRRAADGTFLWPGFGENSRVLAWIADRLDGETDAVPTPVGAVPVHLDVAGLDVDDAAVAAATRVDAAEWRAELPMLAEWFSSLGPTVPGELLAELDRLTASFA